MMKFTTILMSLSFLALCSGNCFAQEEEIKNPTRKGRFISDIDFSLDFGKFDQTNAYFPKDIVTDRTDFVSEIDLSYTIIDNLALGVSLFFDNEKLDVDVPASVDGNLKESKVKKTLNTRGLMASARYYFLDKRIKPFVGANAGIVSFDRKNLSNNAGTKADGNGFAYNLKGGCTFFLNDHIGFEIIYQYNKHEMTEDNKIVPGDMKYETKTKAGTSRILLGLSIAI